MMSSSGSVVPKEYVHAFHDTATGKLKLQIFIKNKRNFRKDWARLQDMKDPETGYQATKKIKDILEEGLKTYEAHMTIEFGQFKVTSSGEYYAVLYKAAVYATETETTTTGISEQVGMAYVDQLQRSLWMGFATPNAKEVIYFQKEAKKGDIFEAELKINCKSPGKAKTVETKAISTLFDISVAKGWGVLDMARSEAKSSMLLLCTLQLNLVEHVQIMLLFSNFTY